MDLSVLLPLLSRFTVARILEREDFNKRYTSQLPIALHEFMYPVMQAYDSTVIDADVEMGGNDQIFNLLAGRDLMKSMDMEPQVALTMPLLEGTDGERKMSKSYKNYIGLTDEPGDMFGKIMSIPDNMIPRYYRLCSTLPIDEIDAIDAQFEAGTANPYELKRALGRNIVDLYHGEGEGQKAQDGFDQVFKNNELPEDIEEKHLELTLNDQGLVYLAGVMAEAGLVASAGEGRRAIDGGGVKINGEAVAPKSYNVEPELLKDAVLQVGKRRFVKLV